MVEIEKILRIGNNIIHLKSINNEKSIQFKYDVHYGTFNLYGIQLH